MRRLTPMLLTLVALATRVPEVHADDALVIPAGDRALETLAQSNAEGALQEVGVTIASLEDAELNGFSIGETSSCLENSESCAEFLARAPVEWVLWMNVTRQAESADADVVVLGKLFSASSGELLQVERHFCERCTSSERLAKAVAALTTKIARAEMAASASETSLEVNATPAEALLRIDGQVVGPTGQPYRVAPGEHQIEISKTGYHPLRHTVTISADQHKSMTVELAKLGDDQASSSGKTWGWLSVGVGAAAIVAGTTWLALDGSGGDSEGMTSESVRDTATLGVVSLAAGGALTLTGILLLTFADDDPDDTVRAAALPTSQGLTFGVTGTF